MSTKAFGMGIDKADILIGCALASAIYLSVIALRQDSYIGFAGMGTLTCELKRERERERELIMMQTGSDVSYKTAKRER